ncbi:hypothetical protein CWI39_2801p0010 [Hamiltosporidium magnivora]|uniref:Uncharacterized protein n=1 Tax=Hamiltosporidium magnivora TaxID=148818 RepID=A0A4Q9KSI1_9MICR|nr:hypothetical protein CWI39_2801p0010 [Hamiltosporidium magnivora]
MSNSFSGKNTNENKYDFHVGETPESIECENDNVLKRSKLTLEIKESLQTYVDLEMGQVNINVDVASSTIDRAHRDFRKLEVDNDDKNFVFLDEVGVAIVRRLTRGRNMRCESAYLYVTAAQDRNI